jgi:hypothetical protein
VVPTISCFLHWLIPRYLALLVFRTEGHVQGWRPQYEFNRFVNFGFLMLNNFFHTFYRLSFTYNVLARTGNLVYLNLTKGAWWEWSVSWGCLLLLGTNPTFELITLFYIYLLLYFIFTFYFILYLPFTLFFIYLLLYFIFTFYFILYLPFTLFYIYLLDYDYV